MGVGTITIRASEGVSRPLFEGHPYNVSGAKFVRIQGEKRKVIQRLI